MGIVQQPSIAQVDDVPTPFMVSPPPAARTLFERLFRRSRPDLLLIALETHLATHPVTHITRRSVEELQQRYGVRGREARDICLTLWRKALEAFLVDATVTDAEAAYLAALRKPLDIAEDAVMQLEEEKKS